MPKRLFCFWEKKEFNAEDTEGAENTEEDKNSPQR